MPLVSYHNSTQVKELAIKSKDSIFDPNILEGSFGIPGWICQIEDLFFDNFTENDCNIFELEILKAIPVGVNLEPVKYKFISYILSKCINMLKEPSSNERLLKAKEEIIPYLESHKDVCEYFISSGYEDNIINDFDFISRVLKASLVRGLSEKEYYDASKECADKLIDLLRSEDNKLLFKFKKIRKEKEPYYFYLNEKSPLVPNDKKINLNFFKSFFKRFF